MATGDTTTSLSKTNQQSQRRRPGRPKGTKNKKTLQRENAIVLRDKIGMFLPEADFKYLTAVLEGEESPELKRDLDIFLTMQLKALLPILSGEIAEGELTREVTQRSSTVKELLALRFQMEKHEKGDDNNNHYTFIQNVFEARGLDPERIATLVSGPARTIPALPSAVPGDVHDDEGSADEA